MIEGNDQSLEYVGYQVPRSDLESNNNSEDPDARAQTQGSLLVYLDSLYSLIDWTSFLSLYLNNKLKVAFKIMWLYIR